MHKKNYSTTFETLQEQYLVTIQENLNQVETKIIKLQHFTQDIKGNIFSILGEIHSIKGSSGSYEFPFLSTVCHNFEDLLTNYLHLSQEDIKNKIDVDKLLKFLDYTRGVVSHYLNHNNSLEEIKQKFNNLSIINVKQTKLNKILLVESVQLLSRAIALSLQGEGYEIAVARDGYEAFGRILNEDFDIVISSQSLKVLDGLDLIKCIKAIKRPNMDIHTILLTSNKHTPISGPSGPDMIFFKNAQMVTGLTNYINTLENNYHKEITIKSEEDTAPKINKILYIDDDETIAPLVLLGLQRNLKPEIKFLLTGKNIISEASAYMPDLVFLDYYLPDCNGPEVLRMFRSDHRFAQIPVIFITGITNEDERKNIMSLGANAVISKPFRVKSLREQVHSVWLDLKNR